MKMRVIVATLATALWFSCADATSSVEQSLYQDIKAAQKNLADTEKRLARERRTWVEKLNRLEDNVLQLRQKTAVARRMADENTVSLTQLQERLDSWRGQQVYQQNLLTRFLRQHQPSQTPQASLPELIAQVVQVAEGSERHFSPVWLPREIALASGEIAVLPSLALGPITWYWDELQQRVGLANPPTDGERQTYKASALLGSAESQQIHQLMVQGQGSISFDPTLSRALAVRLGAESPWEHVAKGGLWTVPILLFAVFSCTIAVLKGVQLWRLPAVVRFPPAQLLSLLRQPALARTQRAWEARVSGPQRALLDIALGESTARQRDDQLFIQLQRDKSWLERWISAIAITASVSPLLGLLGTVSGMIETFKMMTLFGSGDPEVVSGGIAQALITTELGLVVAIPALILNAVLSRRAKAYYLELENFALLLSQPETELAIEPKPISAALPSTRVASGPVGADESREGVPA